MRETILLLLLCALPCYPYLMSIHGTHQSFVAAHRFYGATNDHVRSLQPERLKWVPVSAKKRCVHPELPERKTKGISKTSAQLLGSDTERPKPTDFRAAGIAMIGAVTCSLLLAQPVGAYFQAPCEGGPQLNHHRITVPKKMTNAKPNTGNLRNQKDNFFSDRCSSLMSDADAVAVASSMQGVLTSSSVLEMEMPILLDRTIDDIGAFQNMGMAFIASSLSTMAMHPVDTMKTRVQANKKDDGDQDDSDIKSGDHDGKGKGSDLYDGLLANVAREGPCNAMYLGVYESVKRVLFINPSTTSFAQSWPMLAFLAAGAIGDAAGCLVSMPAEIVKRKVQAGVSSGYVEAITDSLSSKAARAMTMASVSAVFVRDIPEGALQMALYEEWKLALIPMLPAVNVLLLDALLGAAAGGLAAALTTPLDVVLTRLSTQQGNGGSNPGGNGVLEMMQRIVRDEGMAGLWRGAGHRAGYYAPLVGIFFGAYSWLQGLAIDPGRVGVLLHSLPLLHS